MKGNWVSITSKYKEPRLRYSQTTLLWYTALNVSANLLIEGLILRLSRRKLKSDSNVPPLSMFTLLNSKLPRTRPFHAQIRFCVGIFYALSPSKNITFRRLCEGEGRIRSFRSVWLMRWGNSPSLPIGRGLETGVPFARVLEEYLFESTPEGEESSHMCSISFYLAIRTIITKS